MPQLGRPKIYSEDDYPVTVSLRIPRDLAEQMKRYAGRHRQTITELLLDGLRWRLEQDDPRWQSPQTNAYYDNTVLRELSMPVHLVDARIPFDEERPTPAPAAAPGPQPGPPLVTTTPSPRHPQDASQVADRPDTAVILARAKALKAAGRTLPQIAEQLNAEKIPRLRATGPWKKPDVDNLLRERKVKRQAQPV